VCPAVGPMKSNKWSARWVELPELRLSLFALALLCFALLFCSSFSPLLRIALRCFLVCFALLYFLLCFFSLLPVAFVFPLFQLVFNLDVLCWSFASISLSDCLTQCCSLCVPAVLLAAFRFPFLPWAAFRLLLFVLKVSLYFLLFSNVFSLLCFQFPICFVIAFFFAFFSLPVSLSPCLSPSSSLALTCFALLCLLILIQISVLLVLLCFPLFISLMWFSSFQFISLHSFFSFPFLLFSNVFSLVSFSVPFLSFLFIIFLVLCFAFWFSFHTFALQFAWLHGFLALLWFPFFFPCLLFFLWLCLYPYCHFFFFEQFWKAVFSYWISFSP